MRSISELHDGMIMWKWKNDFNDDDVPVSSMIED